MKKNTFVIYSQAAEKSPEVQQARENFKSNHITCPPPMLYTQFLGEFSKYMKTIAITGTHGKSTTTGMVAHSLAKIDDTFGVGIDGAVVTDRGNSYKLHHKHKNSIRLITDHIFSRKGPFVEKEMKQLRFVIEACEYNQHFLHYDPDYAIITNCEIDHVSSYESENDYFETFCAFIRRVNKKVYIPADIDKGLQYCLDRLEENHKAKIHTVPTQQFSFTYLLGGHNNINASLSKVLLEEIAPSQTIQTTLESFKGTGRRAEYIGENNYCVPIISDYGHHPTEISSTLRALKEKYPNEYITTIFQPHQITRIAEFRNAFKDALSLANKRILTPIFAARENFDEIKNSYGDHPISQTNTLREFNSLTAEFFNATLVENEEIVNEIQKIDKGIIIYFTAGDLDGIIRKGL